MSNNIAIQTLINDECNLINDATVARNIAVIWDMYKAKNSILRYHYVRRHVLGYICGKLQGEIDFAVGTDKFTASQKFEHALDLFKQEQAQINLLDTEIGVATLRSITPTPTLPNAFDDQLAALQKGLIGGYLTSDFFLNVFGTGLL